MESIALSLPHLVRPPKVSLRHAPLLLLLHGQESSEKDIFGITQPLMIVSWWSAHADFLAASQAGIIGSRPNWFLEAG